MSSPSHLFTFYRRAEFQRELCYVWVMTTLIPEWKSVAKPVIGMLHLPPLPGSPRYDGDLKGIAERLLRDAEMLADGGVHGLMMENFGDAPFCPRRAATQVVAHMAALAGMVRSRFDLPLGINVLRNDGRSALAVAQASGASFIRVNVLCGARITDQGIIEGIAYELLRERTHLRAEHVKIFADANVKHSAPLGPARPIAHEIDDMIRRGGADALIVSGGQTGQPADLDELRQAKAACGAAPVLLGSGVSCDNIEQYLEWADGFIVGTSIKQDGVSANPVDRERVAALMARLR